jgi:hypothetical protein
MTVAYHAVDDKIRAGKRSKKGVLPDRRAAVQHSLKTFSYYLPEGWDNRVIGTSEDGGIFD